MEKRGKAELGLISALIIFAGFLSVFVVATSSGNSADANLTIWDDTDSAERNTYCGDSFCSQKSKTSTQWDVYFLSNYTNSSGSVINSTQGNGDCGIRFNETGTWTSWSNMSYNSTSFLWEYNRTFNYKGDLNFSTNCTSDFGNISISDQVTITNTGPYIIKSASGYIDFDGDFVKDLLQCAEDVLCTYNFSANVSEDDLNDVLTYTNESTNTTLTYFTLNSSTGILEINITNTTDTGLKEIRLRATDNNNQEDSAILEVNISDVNDAPQFNTFQNWSFNSSELFEKTVNITDEENNIPFVLNITFESCSVAQWSTRNCSNSTGKELFNSSEYIFNGTSGVLNISFTPERNDVGSYIINFTVTDLNNNITPYNASTTQQVNFTVLNINSAPYFRYVCDNERNTTEDTVFWCWVNASDIDETNNITFTANYTWFAFNGTGNNSVSVNANSSTNFNASLLVNFTPSDSEVGNWSVNISITDTGSPQKINSTIFWFYIDNANDSVSLNAISDITAYTSNNYTIYVNASDDDLLIPDESVYNEILTFTSNNSNVSVSGSEISGTNKTQATISFNPNEIGPSGANYSVNITVNDSNRFSTASRVFIISVVGNNPPVWNTSTETNHSLTEGINFYMNLSENVTDADGNNLNFSYSNDTAFPSFSIGETTGIIDFTPTDEDVGQHTITINASDGIAQDSLTFNFTVYNVNDFPNIQNPLPSVTNATIDSSSNINATEDNYTTILLWVHDDDIKIPSNQKNFYNETFTINLTIQGPNSNLFNFTKTGSFPTSSFPNRTEYESIFTPGKTDVGSYNITINITDFSNSSDTIVFNLTVFEIDHNPVLMTLENQTSKVNASFYYAINATDAEDGSSNISGSNTNLTFSHALLSGNDIFNSTTFNSTTGVFNITFNSSQGGSYHINITVNDTSGMEDSGEFWIFVYDAPNITLPLQNFQFSLTENQTSNLTFSANHSVGDNLTYMFYIDGVLRNSLSYHGNNTNLTWQFTPNFTDETLTGSFNNLTLTVLNPSDSDLNITQNWNMTINHTNYPLEFSATISDKSGGSPLQITLSDHFTDIDASDTLNNQTIGFTYNLVNGSESGGAITVSIINWTNSTPIPTINFSASSSGSANYSITAYEFNLSNSSQILNNVSSNNFSVSLTVSTATVTVPTSGGGGSVVTKPISLKIIVPDPVSAKKKDHLILPIKIENAGKVDLKEIILASIVAKDSVLRNDIIASFDDSFISILRPGESVNRTLIVDINTEELGFYEVTINGTVKNPKYSDWAKLYINVEEAENVEERILFTEEFIIGNPECTELKELVDEARDYLSRGDSGTANEKLDEALEACRRAIEQQPSLRIKKKLEEYIFNYIGLASVVIFVLGFLYYSYRRRKLRRESFEQQNKLKKSRVLGFFKAEVGESVR